MFQPRAFQKHCALKFNWMVDICQAELFSDCKDLISADISGSSHT